MMFKTENFFPILLTLVTICFTANLNAKGGNDGGGSGVLPPPPPPSPGTIATRQARLTNNTSELSRFGQSVALSGSTAVVGAPRGNVAYIFQRTATGWSTPVKLTEPATTTGFGTTVAISGNTVAVSTLGSATVSPAIHVYVRNTVGAWVQQARLVAPATCKLGTSVSMSNNTIAIGGACATPATGAGSGVVYVFVRSGSVWSQQAKLLPPANFTTGIFGYSTAIQGDKIVVGTYLNGQSAFVFQRIGTVWSQQARLVSPTVFTDFGKSVAINGTTIMVGAPLEWALNPSKGKLMSAAGAVYAYDNVGTAWIQTARLTEGNKASNNNQFGASISISGTRVVIGDDKGFAESGNAQVFQKVAGVWNTSGFAVGPVNPVLGDQFGSSVSLDANTFIVGSPGEGPGIPPNSAGAAHVFTLPAL